MNQAQIQHPEKGTVGIIFTFNTPRKFGINILNCTTCSNSESELLGYFTFNNSNERWDNDGMAKRNERQQRNCWDTFTFVTIQLCTWIMMELHNL
jgi:hypothetical protein